MFDKFEKRLIRILEIATVAGLALLVLAMGTLFIYHVFFKMIWRLP